MSLKITQIDMPAIVTIQSNVEVYSCTLTSPSRFASQKAVAILRKRAYLLNLSHTHFSA